MATEAEQRAAVSHCQPEVTTADLGVMVNGHLNTLLEAMQQGRTERLIHFLHSQTAFTSIPDATMSLCTSNARGQRGSHSGRNGMTKYTADGLPEKPRS